MSIIVAILAILATFIVSEVWLGINRAVSKPQPTAELAQEKQDIVFRKLWVDVIPAPLKVIIFADGKIEGRLVMHGPYQGVVTRLLLLWKGDKHRSIKLDAMCGIRGESIEEVYSTSFEEAKKIAQSVYGKKKQSKTEAITQRVVPQPKTEATFVPVVVAQKAEVSQASAQKAVHEQETPVIKGFKARYVGKIVSAQVEPHVKTTNGHPEEYTAFTLTLDTEDGPERITGNDLKRAIAHAEVRAGDNIRVIHIKDVDSPNGFKKKSYQIVKLANCPV